MIDKHNILELLGGDKNKYHSCIITCYSFDFLFFEQRVLPRLRQAGIININLFVDEKMYQQQVNSLEGSYRKNTSYSITPVLLHGAFHPKIIMGFGKNNGFLGIGSGNLTNSGLSSNDEVWGAFHTYKTESEATPLFKNTFEYVYNLEPFSFGINKTKWEWILKNSQWLNEIIAIPNLKNSITIGKETLSIFSSLSNRSIYNQIIEKLPKETLESLVIVSPYYNKKGQILEQFITDLNPKKVKVIVDSRFGTIPYLFNNTMQVQFYDWQNVKNVKEHQSPRLHAKIIQFNFQSKSYLLLGSANATEEALGTKNNNTKNAEVSLFLAIDENKDWLTEMELEFPENGDFNLATYVPIEIQHNTLENEKFLFKIQHAELDFTKLSINGLHFKKLNDNYFLKVIYKDETFDQIVLNEFANNTFFSIEISTEEISNAYKIYIIDKEGNKQSNSALLHHYQSIIKTNPDEKSLRFMDLINQETLPDDNLLELLEYAFFDKKSIHYNSNTNALLSRQLFENTDDKEYHVLDEKDFNKNEEIIDAGSNSVSNHLTLLESFLDHIVIGSKTEEDFSDSNEITAEEAKEGAVDSGNDRLNLKDKLSYADGMKLRNKLESTLKNIYDETEYNHSLILESILDKNSLPKIPVVNGIKNILLGLHLLFMKMNDSFNEERIKLKITYQKIDDLIKFEKEKGFNIKRMQHQEAVSKNEVAFSADDRILSNIDAVVLRIKDIHITYIDETPSIIINHKYFLSNPVYVNSTIYLCTYKGYLINIVAPLLLQIRNVPVEENDVDYSQYSIYKERLLYRSLLLFASNFWTSKEDNYSQMFLLNLFDALLPNNANYQNIITKLENQKNKLKVHLEEHNFSKQMIETQLSNYIEWKKRYILDKTQFIKTLDKYDVQKIIYKNNIGFSRIVTIYSDEIKVETPLGYLNYEAQFYEINGLKNGTKGILYPYQ